MKVAGLTISPATVNTADLAAAVIVHAEVQNIGGAPAAGHEDRVAIVGENRQPTNSDPQINLYYVAGPVAIGDTFTSGYTFSRNFLATFNPGNYFVCYEANWSTGDRVVEITHDNNWACQPLTITNGPPDLKVTGLTVSPASVNTADDGATVVEHAEVQNIGSAPAAGHEDRVAILSENRQPTLNSNSNFVRHCDIWLMQ